MKERKLFLLAATLLCISIFFSACSSKDNDKHPQITYAYTSTSNGPIKGIEADGISLFKNIPYAKPPLGDLRFAPPEDMEPWSETLDCTEYGKVAVQASPQEGFEMSEDCLFLNIWTSAEEGEKLPVYVWIHGGGYAQGSGAYSLYDGTSFAENEIVMVTINYRLNALGYFASQHTYDMYGTTGNWGLLDQIKALEWVQENIAAFGGDPERVTIGGESAGAYSASALILSPLADGLFSAAIMESGSILGVPGNNFYARGNLEHCIELSNMMAYTFDAKDNAAGLSKLREADAKVLAQLSPLNLDFTDTSAFLMEPVFDGYVMPKEPFEALEKGEFNKVKLLWGYNANEGSIFVPGDTNEDKYNMLASRMYGYDAGQKVLERFQVDEDNTAGERAREVLGYGMFNAVMLPFGDALANSGEDVYAYYFNYATADNIKKELGACHGSEILYAFGNLTNANKEQLKVQKEMHTRWVNFIKNGDPNIGEKVSIIWPKYDTMKYQMIMFDKNVTTGEMPFRDDMDFMLKLIAGEAYFRN